MKALRAPDVRNSINLIVNLCLSFLFLQISALLPLTVPRLIFALTKLAQQKHSLILFIQKLIEICMPLIYASDLTHLFCI